MKLFKVITTHEVYEDSYTEGESKHTNCYTVNSEQEAENLIEAIEKHYYNDLYFSNFNKDYLSIEDGEDYAHYSVLVDAENYEPSEKVKLEWKRGIGTLYSNNITFEVWELTKQTFKN